MFLRHALAIAAVAIANVAAAQVVSLRPDESVTVRFENGRAVIADRGPAPPLNDYQRALVHRMQMQSIQIPPDAGVVAPEPIYPEDFDGKPPPVPLGGVTIAFHRVPSLDPRGTGDSVLTLTNGYDQAFRYRTIMHGNGRSAPTDVCEVMPRKLGTEHWPYIIEWFELSDLRLEPSLEGTIRCQ